MPTLLLYYLLLRPASKLLTNFHYQNKWSMDKRSFLKGLAMTGLSAPLSAYSMGNWTDRFNKIPAPSITGNDVWTDIRNGYKLKPDYINLENGYYNFLPEEILENFI